MGLTEALLGALDALPAPLVVLLIAALPVAEVRGSIPVGILAYGMPWPWAAGLSLLGNLVVVPLLWKALPFLEKVGRRVAWVANGLDWVFTRTRRKHSKKVDRAEHAGLFAIVALPLPGAGTWTAVLTGYVLGMDRRKAWPTIVAGAVVEVALITLVVVTGSHAFRWLVSL